jgi:fused signal recognition particle receptor
MSGWLGSFKKGLKKTTSAMGLGSLLGSTLDDDLLDDLEDRLLMSDMGPAFVTDLVDRLRADVSAGKLKSSSEVLPWLESALLAVLKKAEPLTSSSCNPQPAVWFFLGVNGVGKTTSLGKLGKRLSDNGFSLLFGAGDTFRAAAAEQLQRWSERCGAQLVRHREGGDPSAVVFDAYEAASKRKVDFLLIDTAGRLHNKKNLMAECAKMFRTVERQDGKIEEVFLVLDASTGQNAVQQAKLFAEVAPLTGIILTKLDGSAKGGVVFQLVQDAGVPVRYVGVGEKEEDLIDFDAEAFVSAILSDDEA